MFGETAGVIHRLRNKDKSSYESIYVSKHLLLELPQNKVCPLSFRPWAFKHFMAKGQICYCGLARRTHVEKYQ
jgi:hypothetical protein